MADRGEERLAPVIPLFGRERPRPEQDADDGSTPSPRHPAAAARHPHVESVHEPDEAAPPAPRSHLRAVRGDERKVDLDWGSAPGVRASTPQATVDLDDDEALRDAADVLVRKLRSRSLSCVEARAVLREQGLGRDDVETVIDDFLARRYLDDHALAETLVDSGSRRKGQGRVALARSLAQRGIPREVIDDALSALPDDDAERALEFARSKAGGMRSLEADTALRRLLGQLARRGYTGSVARDAAKTALREAGSGRSGVRFVESD